jgi:sec-independent protein translocase protein TatB
MFDISWSEFLLIGVVALIVIGPKELPAVMRTMGQWTRKVRGMASEFQNQFHEAMREAEMADLKKEVDTMARDVKDSVTGLDPLKEVRADVSGIGEDVKRTLSAAPSAGETAPTAEPAPALPPVVDASAETPAGAPEAAVTPQPERSASPSEQSTPEIETVGAAADAEATQPAEKSADTDAAGRAG